MKHIVCYKGEEAYLFRVTLFGKEFTYVARIDGEYIYIDFNDCYDPDKDCYIRRLYFKQNGKYGLSYEKWKDEGDRCGC